MYLKKIKINPTHLKHSVFSCSMLFCGKLVLRLTVYPIVYPGSRLLWTVKRDYSDYNESDNTGAGHSHVHGTSFPGPERLLMRSVKHQQLVCGDGPAL